MIELVGKTVAHNHYLHIQSLHSLDEAASLRLTNALQITGRQPGQDFNVIKIVYGSPQVTLLDYPGFFTEAFPILNRYWTVDVDAGSFRYRTYEDSLNPPLLHRKELLLPPGYPGRDKFSQLTQTAEQLGLFDAPKRIGFKQAWDALLRQHGYEVVDHDLIPIANADGDENPDNTCGLSGVARHRTALTRHGFSAPIQTLSRFGYLDGSKTLFDYGCGRGDDLRGLLENNVLASGWDPYYAPEQIKRQANIVNLGFVINVIESVDERIEALKGAFALASELLVVSAMIASRNAITGRPYGDGVLTQRNTFQKYYTQSELREFIAETLHEDPIPVGPGILYVFKDKDAEQLFMLGRVANKRSILRLSHLSRPRKPERVDHNQAKYNLHQDLLESLWETCLMLGRDPDRSEVVCLTDITSAFGSLPAALRFLKSRKKDADEILHRAGESRRNDLCVYFAQQQFEKYKPYRRLDPRLQRDIKYFFGDYSAAIIAGRQLLFALGDLAAIGQACRVAAEHGIGWLEEGASLQLHTSLIEQLPPLLRAYVRCGTVLYGDPSDADLIKIHTRSGKLTLMKFDDFSGKPLPRMIQRIKLNFKRQDFDVFDYGDTYDAPYLFRKSRFVNEEFPFYAEQVAFEVALDSLGAFDLEGYGPPSDQFDKTLDTMRYQVDGFNLIRSQTFPGLDTQCGRYFRFRDFIESGETQASSGIPNLPRQPDTYTALLELATQILDPVIDYYGRIELTYGFCSSELSKQIKGRIAPKLDQHASHELNRQGKPICERLGAAVDFLVKDENMLEVACWIAENLNFDRLYYYGSDRPIHISYGTYPARQITTMLANNKSSHLIPRTYSAEEFMAKHAAKSATTKA